MPKRSTPAWPSSSGTSAKARAISRLTALLGWTLAVLPGIATAASMASVPPNKRSARSRTYLSRAYSWRARQVARWARGVVRIIGAEVRVQGPIPEPPFFLVANHLSYIDIVLLKSIVPCVFVSKADVKDWPIVGTLAEMAGTLFIRRESRADVARINEQVGAVIQRGEGIVIFPEGTSTDGQDVLPFKSSLLAPAVASGRSIAHASIQYQTPPGAPPAETAVCWWGDMTFADHLWRLLMLPGFRATVRFGVYHPAGNERKEVARDLTERVRHNMQERPATAPSAAHGENRQPHERP